MEKSVECLWDAVDKKPISPKNLPCPFCGFEAELLIPNVSGEAKHLQRINCSNYLCPIFRVWMIPEQWNHRVTLLFKGVIPDERQVD